MSNSSFFDFHCPLGGQWYACSSGSNFVGCCTTDPCANGCVQGNLRAAGYNISHHGEWPDASCGSASDFFTCSAGDSFWGCCKTNACAATPPATCTQGDLVPAFMERPEQFNAYVSAAATSESNQSNTGAIAGGVVGGVVALAIIGALIIFFLRRKKHNKKSEELGAASMMPMTSDKSYTEQPGAQSPPPTYSAPSQDFYQNMSPTKGHQSYHQYASHSEGPAELPAGMPLAAEHRYSELPDEISTKGNTHRYSELPASATTQLTELESPQTSPRPQQTSFSANQKPALVAPN
ncbi:hypothetical protein ACN47E_000347 [Coniothyrium glycines]